MICENNPRYVDLFLFQDIGFIFSKLKLLCSKIVCISWCDDSNTFLTKYFYFIRWSEFGVLQQLLQSPLFLELEKELEDYLNQPSLWVFLFWSLFYASTKHPICWICMFNRLEYTSPTSFNYLGIPMHLNNLAPLMVMRTGIDLFQTILKVQMDLRIGWITGLSSCGDGGSLSHHLQVRNIFQYLPKFLLLN